MVKGHFGLQTKSRIKYESYDADLKKYAFSPKSDFFI